MSKVQIVNRPLMLPQKCAVCGANKVGPNRYVDIGLDVDRYGRVYFCSVCFVNVSLQTGVVVHSRDLAVANAKADIWKQKLKEAQTEIEDLKNVVSSLHYLNERNPAVDNSGTISVDETAASSQGPTDSGPAESTASRKSGSVSKAKRDLSTAKGS